MISNFSFSNRKGAALIAVVSAILLFSVLAAAIVPMVSSSRLQSVNSNQKARAYLLAESGYRLAASRFMHAGASEQIQNQALENLEGDYNLNGNGGQFSLEAYSYFYELMTPVSGENQFLAHTPGSFPGVGALPDDPGDEVVLDSNLKLRIGNRTYILTPGSSPVAGFNDRVNFFVNPSLSSYPAGTPVYPVADVDLFANTTLSEGGDLAYESGDGRMFPLRNGYVQVNGRTLSYRFNDRNANQLIDVRASAPPVLANFDLTADPEIVLTRYVRIHATGIHGSGDMQTQRLVVYYTPLPPSESNSEQQEYSDPFDTKASWSDTAGTTTTTGIVGTDSALKVEASVSGIDQKSALTTFAPDPSSSAASAIDFSASQRGTRGFLSYDTQIKIGYETIPAPTQGYFPTPPLPAYPIPSYVGAGLSFRLGTVSSDLFSNNGYGVSILRGNDSVVDDIPDELLPLQNQRAIVLWRLTNNGGQRTWLAYKRLADLFIDENSEDDTSNAFNDGSGSTDLWDLEPRNPLNPDRGRQRPGSLRNWYYGLTSNHTYNLTQGGVPVRNVGIVQSNTIQLPANSPEIALTFWSWHQTEPGRLGTHDLKQVRVTNSSGTPLRTYTIDGAPAPVTISGPEDGWYQYQVGDLSDFAGQNIRIQFRFDTVDELNNDFEGWYVDDIQLSVEWPAQQLQEATLALSLKEAMVVRFSNGVAEIRSGERIYGGTRGTQGTVLTPPLITSGSWGGSSPASGTLLLNRATVSTTGDPFGAGEQLFVMGNTGSAQVDSWDTTNDTKANIIQVYIATRDGSGSGGNNDPLDRNTEPYGRIGLDPSLTDLRWPPVLNSAGIWTDDDGNWTPSEDYFRQIEWDEINPSASGLSFLPFTPAGQNVVEQGIIQSHHVQLQTPDYPGIYSASEVGLHSFGDGAENIFFDDFGIRLNVFETDILPTPIQQ